MFGQHFRTFSPEPEQELLSDKLKSLCKAPLIRGQSWKNRSFSLKKMGGYRWFLAFFEGLNTDRPLLLVECQTRAQASAIVETHLGDNPMELKPFFAMAAYSRALSWLKVERAASKREVSVA